MDVTWLYIAMFPGFYIVMDVPGLYTARFPRAVHSNVPRVVPRLYIVTDVPGDTTMCPKLYTGL